MLVKNKDASSIILRNQNKTLYANYIIQQTKFQGGCLGRITLESGRTGDYSIVIKLKEGEQLTTLLEQQTDVSANLCPVLSTPSLPDPYLSDQIYLSLTTNQAVYRAAALGAWIPVTSTEYSAIQTSVTNTTLVGATTTLLNNAISQSLSASASMFISNFKDTTQPAIPANSYIFAAAFQWRDSTSKSDIQLYANTNSAAPTTGYSKVGGYFPSTGATGVQYYIRKGVAATNGATEGILGLYTGATSTNGRPSGYWIGWRNVNGLGIRYLLTETEPTSSTTLTSSISPPSNYYIGIQALTTTSVQWVT
jgi:hypothetical protein